MYLSICLCDRKQKHNGGNFIGHLTNNISKDCFACSTCTTQTFHQEAAAAEGCRDMEGNQTDQSPMMYSRIRKTHNLLTTITVISQV